MDKITLEESEVAEYLRTVEMTIIVDGIERKLTATSNLDDGFSFEFNSKDDQAWYDAIGDSDDPDAQLDIDVFISDHFND